MALVITDEFSKSMASAKEIRGNADNLQQMMDELPFVP